MCLIFSQEWQLKNSSKAVFHWDLLEQANKDKLALSSKEEILKEGQRNADSRETLMFWINQVRRRVLLVTYMCPIL